MDTTPDEGLRLVKLGVRSVGALLLLGAGAVKLVLQRRQRRVLDRLRDEHMETWMLIRSGGRRGTGDEALNLWLVSEDHRSLGDAELSTMMRKVRDLEDKVGILGTIGGGLFGLSLFGR